MDLWYILGGFFLAYSIPWAILQISDGMFVLNQIFRVVYWGSFVITYELTGFHWGLCLLLAHIPGALIWTCYDYYFDDNSDRSHIFGDRFEFGTPVEKLSENSSIFVWNIQDNTISE